MSSSIPTFKARLLTRLQADSNLTGVQVTWGHPHPTPTEGEWIKIGNAVPAEGQEPRGLGTTNKTESYSIPVTVSCIANPSAKSAQVLEERACTLAGYIETSMNNWQTASTPYGGSPICWALVDSVDTLEAINQEGTIREGIANIKIIVEAFI